MQHESYAKSVDSKNTILTSALLLAVLGFVGYTLGLLKNAIIAAFFGASPATDAYFVATSIPYLIYCLLVNPLYFAVIPLYNEYKETGGLRESRKVISAATGVLLIISLPITIGVFWAAPNIIKLLAPGFDAINIALAAKIAGILSTTIMFVAVSNIFSGVLHAERHFALPALKGPIQNIFIVSFIIVLVSKAGIFSAALGSVSGIVIMSLLLYIGMVRWVNYSGKITLKHAGIIKGGRFSIPLILGALANKGNVIIDRIMASRLSSGSISALSYGYFLVNFAHTIFSLSISTVVYSDMSATAAKSDEQKLQQTLQQSLRLLSLIIVPVSIGLIILNRPIIEVLFQRGAFDSNDTIMTSRILLYYSIGLFAVSLSSILRRALFAIQNFKIHAKVGILAFMLKIVFNLVLLRQMGLPGIALSTSLVYITVFLILLIVAQRQIPFNLMQDVGYYCKVIVSSLIMAFVVLLSFYLSGKLFPSIHLLFRIFQLVVVTACGMVVFFATAIVFKIHEIRLIFQIIKRKWKL